MVNKRSQIYSYELLFVIVFVVILFLVLAFSHYRYSVKIDGDLMFEQMKQTTLSAADTLLGSRGYPVNWERYGTETPQVIMANVETFGLLKRAAVLDDGKINMFVLLLNDDAYRDTVKKKLGLGAYKFYVAVDTAYDTSGGDQLSTAKTKYVLTRNIIYKGSEGVISFVVGK